MLKEQIIFPLIFYNNLV